MISKIVIKSKLLLKIITILSYLSISATLLAMEDHRETSLISDKIPVKKIKQNNYKITCKKENKLTKRRIDKIFQEITEISKLTEQITGIEIEICLISYRNAKYLAGKASKHELIGLVVPHNDKYFLTYKPLCVEIPKRPWRAQKIETKNKKTIPTRNPGYTPNSFDQRMYPIPTQYGNGYNYYYTGRSNLVGIPGGF